jgi:hypothetical protein
VDKKDQDHKWHLHLLTLQRGVTSARRHSENITCCGVTSSTCRAALSLSFDYISTTWKENVTGCFVRVHEGAGSLMVWETFPINYCLIFFSPLEIWVFFLQSLISQAALWVSGTRK